MRRLLAASLAAAAACGGTTPPVPTSPPPLGTPLTGLCAYVVAPVHATMSVGSIGGEFSFPLVAPPGCSYNISSSAPLFLKLTETTGTGNMMVRFTVLPNPGSLRIATVTVSGPIVRGQFPLVGSTVTVTQAAAAQSSASR